ncbi:DUF2865 domain-containing protein [Shinella daejeonensis]|uniref:DUF2865 domain-containing protein n=1 Tax=Shinella daejeonensis TaxID=659017 RepID=UPI0020C7F469|nr:DUF2865 domain-containing protein [Shinella daejeonensis]
MRAAARLVIAGLSCLPLLLWGDAAMADRCDRLRTELANLPRVVADTKGARKYASAIARQNIQLRKAKDQMRRLGCSGGSIVVFGGRNAAACGTLADAADRMQRNLQVLDSKRRELAAGKSNNGRRTRLLAALETGRCNERKVDVMPAATTETLRALTDEGKNGQGFGMLPEGGDRLGLRPLGTPRGHGNLRTVCVRTCDGGFFPISSGATPLDFRRDQQVCAMMCPQTETELFYHPLTGMQGTEQMTSSVTGRRYSELPNAFAYRTRDLSRPDTCGCNLGAYHREMIRREKALKGEDAPAGNHSSITHVRGTLPPEAVAQDDMPASPPAPVVERAYDPDARKVRIVGPVFLPADTSSIDLRHPAGVN